MVLKKTSPDLTSRMHRINQKNTQSVKIPVSGLIPSNSFYYEFLFLTIPLPYQTIRITKTLELQRRPDLLVDKAVILLAVGVLGALVELMLIAKAMQKPLHARTPLALITKTLVSVVTRLIMANAQKFL